MKCLHTQAHKALTRHSLPTGAIQQYHTIHRGCRARWRENQRMERERLRHRHTDTARTLLQALAPVASSNRTAHAASSKVPYQHPSKQSTIVTKHNSNVRSQYLVDQRGQVPGFRTALARYEPFWVVLLQMLECGAALRRNRDPL